MDGIGTAARESVGSNGAAASAPSRNGAAAIAEPRAPEPETISQGEFQRLRPALESYLEASFRRLSPECREEVVNDAFLALHKARRRWNGSAVSERQATAYLKHAAASLAIDRARRARHPVFGAEAHDPTGRLLAELRAAGPSPEDEVEVALSDRELTELAGGLTEQEAGVMKRSVLWGWAPDDVMTDLGLTRKRYERLRARALMKVARRLEEAGGELWARGKSRLIAALIAGTADGRQIKQARALAKESAEFRLALAQYEATLHSVALAIPADVALRADHGMGIVERAIAVVDRARDAVGGVRGRSAGASDGTVAQQLSSGGTRGAGAAGTGVLAKLGSSGIGAKLIAACLAGGAAAGGCIAAGVIPGVALPGLHESTASAPSHVIHHTPVANGPPSGPAANPVAVAVPSDPPPTDTTPAPPPGETTTTTTTTQTAPPPPPVAKAFGVEPTAPSSTSSSPASSSGSGGGGGGGGSPVGREFGP